VKFILDNWMLIVIALSSGFFAAARRAKRLRQRYFAQRGGAVHEP
jgi:hypothetical protein